MEWEQTRYRNFLIWVGKLREGEWVASWHALPERGAMATPGPGEGEVVSGESREDAIEAAKRRIDDKIDQRHKS